MESSVIVERVDDVDKEKKKKRRSNRRSKHNSAFNSVNEARGETSDSMKSDDKTKKFGILYGLFFVQTRIGDDFE